MTELSDPICRKCGEEFSRARFLLGFIFCLACGEKEARQKKHCVVPMHKSGLVVISPNEPELLKGIGNKGGQISGGGQNFGSPTELAGRNRNRLVAAVVCNFDDMLGPEEFRRKVGTPKRRIYAVKGGGVVVRLTRQPWHKRSEPIKK